MLKILTVTALYVTVAIMEQVFAYTEACVGEFCFTTPASDEMMNIDDARYWCAAHNSTLSVVKDSETHMALAQFLNSSNIRAMTYINIKLSQLGNTWFLVNGSNYRGGVGGQENDAYKLFCCLKPTDKAEFPVVASSPTDLRKYVCDFEGTRCMNNSRKNILFQGRCYVKYENENLTWYQARERCINNGGDLAQFQNGSNGWIPPFDTSWLDTSFTYYVGIRWSGWSWRFPDDGTEIVYSAFLPGKPNNVNYSCICADPSGIPIWGWTDCSCSVARPFVCLKTATMVTTTTPGIDIATSTKKSNELIVGLVLGLGVILPLTVLTVAIIVWNVRLRRQLRENCRTNENTSTAAKTSRVDLDKDKGVVDASDTKVQYHTLQRETILGSAPAVPLYTQLDQPENRDYEIVES